MKKTNLLALFVIAVSASVNAWAALSGAKKELLLDIKEETKKCAIQSIASQGNDKKVTGYKSVCSSLRILAQDKAQIFIDGEWFSVTIKESKESDGGDLDDLFVYNAKGAIVAQRINIAAYDNIIVAMAGTTDLHHN